MRILRYVVAGAHFVGFLLHCSFALERPNTFIGLSEQLQSHFTRIQAGENSIYCEPLFVRGGNIDLVDGASGNFMLTKLRNAIRGILSIGDKKAKPLSTLLRGCLKTIESIIGIKLLPPSKPAKQSKAKKAKSVLKEKKTGDVKDVLKSSSKTTASAATQKHLASKIKSTNPNYRIQRELKEFIKSPPPNLTVKVGSNIRVWIITMEGAKKSIYEGETFKLRISFPPQYPTVPPSVYFLQGHIPTHEHVYTNGDICLSLLGKHWRPTMTAQSIAVSILSILSSAQSKSLPMDNARHAGNKPGEYQKDWVYHDDNC